MFPRSPRLRNGLWRNGSIKITSGQALPPIRFQEQSASIWRFEETKTSMASWESHWIRTVSYTHLDVYKRQKRSRLFRYREVQLYLFAKSEFTKGCIDRAREMGNVTLVTYKDILPVSYTHLDVYKRQYIIHVNHLR